MEVPGLPLGTPNSVDFSFLLFNGGMQTTAHANVYTRCTPCTYAYNIHTPYMHTKQQHGLQ